LVPAGAMQEAAETPSAHRAVPEEVAEASALGGQRYRRRTATTTATGTAATGTDAAEVDSTDAAGAPAPGRRPTRRPGAPLQGAHRRTRTSRARHATSSTRPPAAPGTG